MVGQTKHKPPFSNHPAIQQLNESTQQRRTNHPRLGTSTLERGRRAAKVGQSTSNPGQSTTQPSQSSASPSRVTSSGHKLPSSAHSTSPAHTSSASQRLDQVVQHLDSASEQLNPTPSSIYGKDGQFRDPLNFGKDGRQYGSPVMSLKESIDNSFKVNEPIHRWQWISDTAQCQTSTACQLSAN